MGKRKWQRIKPTDLADPETQQCLMALMDQVKGQPAPDSPGGECCKCTSCSCRERTSESPQVE